MIARVVTKRDDARLALAATAASALGLAAIIVDDLVGARVFEPPGVATYSYVALLIALGGIGPWLTWTRRGAAMAVRCEPGVVRVGEELRIEAGDVTALAIAEAVVGRSVAIARGKKVVFLEVERADEALRLSQALNVPEMPFGDLRLHRSSRLLAALQTLIALVALAFGPLYFLAATTGFDPWLLHMSGKTLFGIGGVVTSWVGMALLIARRLIPGQAMTVGHGAWDAHVALHRARAADAVVDATRTDEERSQQAALRAD